MTEQEQAVIFARNIVTLWNEYSDENSEESDNAMRDTFKAVLGLDLHQVDGVLASPLNYFAQAYLTDHNPEDLTFAEMTESLEISLKILDEEASGQWKPTNTAN